MKWPESWKAAVSEARTMSQSNGISEWRRAGPLIDVQQTGQDALAFPVGLVPVFRRPFGRAGGGALRAGEGISGAGHDDDTVLGIASHVDEHLRELFMRAAAPLQGPAVRMECHLQDAVPALHTDAWVFIRVLVQRGHNCISR